MHIDVQTAVHRYIHELRFCEMAPDFGAMCFFGNNLFLGLLRKTQPHFICNVNQELKVGVNPFSAMQLLALPDPFLSHPP